MKKPYHRNPLFYVAFALLFMVGRYCYTPSIPVEAILEDEPSASQASMAARPSSASSETHPPLGLLWPLEGRRPGRPYGWVRAARDRTRWTFHNGVDAVAPTGTPLRAADGGRVYRARYMGACGNGVIILHIRPEHRRATTTYCHLERFAVEEGQEVERGEKIGEVGSTGNSTTPHLHFAVHINGKHTEPLRHVVEGLP